jgi:hypothetical protein
MARDLAALLKALRVDDVHAIHVRRLAPMFAGDEAEREYRAISLHANVGVTKREAELLMQHGARDQTHAARPRR